MRRSGTGRRAATASTRATAAAAGDGDGEVTQRGADDGREAALDSTYSPVCSQPNTQVIAAVII